jgi:periplasmic protein TonB
MAFVDSTALTRLNPVGIATAIGMNALFLFGLASLAPNAGAEEEYVVTEMTNYVDEPEKPPVQQQIAEKRPIKAPVVSIPVTHDLLPPPLPPVDFTDRVKIDLPPLPPTPPFVEPILPPLPPAPVPVLVGPRYDARFASSQQPEYPSDMARTETEGTAVVRVLIGVDGRVKQVEEVRSDHSSFFDATRKQALNKWRFKPATRDGVPYESWREMKVHFEMPARFS